MWDTGAILRQCCHLGTLLGKGNCHVVHRLLGLAVVRQLGRASEGEVLSHHGRKREAVCAAARLARRDRPSVLQIQRRDGSIESRRVYRHDALVPGG